VTQLSKKHRAKVLPVLQAPQQTFAALLLAVVGVLCCRPTEAKQEQQQEEQPVEQKEKALAQANA
jgi:hypothetical protein